MTPGIDFPHIYSGKVRDIYEAGGNQILLVASDRMSAFDVVMAEAIPHKGRVLTGMSAYWFGQVSDVIGSHLIATQMEGLDPWYDGRIMLCRRAEMLPIECIVRGYLSGSAWKEYRERGTVHGMAMPSGLRESERLPEPIFTPSTKADAGHDENISFDQAVNLIGAETANAARDASLAIYARGAEKAAEHGIIVADTKFELGFIDGELVLADEVMTPDSSRFWPEESWRVGETPPSFDKQPLRDYLESLDWNKQPPPPALPAEVIEATSRRYVDAYERVTGLPFAEWDGVGVK